ncbi:serine hydrolase domain-containing protein [Effusibacillus lacus]|uniref:Beta-lactamase-related domain-containing protein n=1 Tax=Effusibacillus lacus TaxID=1348429 RepID=A0A292YSI7_9BACL|nr:serine hydrolase domain-containing protein [Effusibacillus lacus]TCS75876.1 CubicO group peptidase (beta-lactamase class C family) [Effusibacillus lacus]GAX91733.1 hypothetical protein EFBL_3424 [Effusibacillus lacus]
MDFVKKTIETMEKGIANHVFPGAVIHLARTGQTVLFDSFGHAELTPTLRQMDKNMVFDLASLTKVMATLPAVLRSVQFGKIDLEAPVGHYLPQWRNQPGQLPREQVTVGHLLTHTSGLPAWRPFYLSARSPEHYLRLICEEPLVYPAGAKVVYSDLGFILLGFLLEHIWQKPLAELCRELVFEPLELENTGYGTDLPRERVVATEVGNRFEMQMCREFAERCLVGKKAEAGFRVAEQDIDNFPWRTETICGQVNDGNAFYGLQGISGHAGLFSTASDVARYLTMWTREGVLDDKEFLQRNLVRAAVRNHTPALNIARAYGFEVAPERNAKQWEAGCSAGPAANPGAFGHTGFTGTSMWWDPNTRTEVVILTNRIHPQVRDGMTEWRRRLHKAAFSKE